MQVKSKNLIVGALATLLVLVLWYRVVYSPMEAKAAKANSLAHDAEQSTKSMRASMQTANNTKKPKKVGEVGNKQLTDAIPNAAQLSDFLRKANLIGAASGVSLQTITQAQPTVTGNAGTITVAITVQGDYDQVESYINGMRSLPRLLVIDSASYNASTASGAATPSGGGPVGKYFAGVGAAPTLQVQLSARIFMQPPAGLAIATAPGLGSAPSGKASTPATPTGGPTAPPGVQNS